MSVGVSADKIEILNQFQEFLNEDTKTTKQKIKDSVYIMMDLN